MTLLEYSMSKRRKLAAAMLPAVFCIIALQCSPSHTDAATPATTKSVSSSEAAPAQAKGSSVAGLRFVVAPMGNEVRYRIREQLVRVDLPNDAIGRTSEISGGIVLSSSGELIPSESKFVARVGSLKSDRDRRDGFVRRNVLVTDQYPTVEFSPTAVRGLPKSLPTSGSHKFDVVGNLTVKGVTRPTTWRVNAEAKNGQVTGSASTGFTFSDFNIEQPRVPIVLSVADTIKLEYDFTLVQQN
jgi:polyisoprenoid-binding protein YceI